ncbi:hemolysin-III related-domain-containing protein [Globomyces pollinis-pini]|nr:hemolysin-III related-domain-containing protein [Globomyces pollinis-pini]
MTVSSMNSPKTLRFRTKMNQGIRVEDMSISREILINTDKKKLKTFDCCPEYMKDNDCILTGYRVDYSYPQSWFSLFQCHNETGNVWTHLLGTLLFLGLIIYTWFAPIHELATMEERLVLTIFLVLHCYTLLCSSMFHLHLCVSEEAFKFWGCLDFSGISASIGGGAISIMYFLLHCDGGMRIFWIGSLVIMNLVGIIGPVFKLTNQLLNL